MKLRAFLETRHEVLEAYLFGSAAADSAQAHSDIDVAVYVGEPRPSPSTFGYAADLTTGLMRALETNRIDLFITSTAAAETRHYAWIGPINQDAIDARVWGGIHFRTADAVGNQRGQQIARYVVSHAFQPTDD